MMRRETPEQRPLKPLRRAQHTSQRRRVHRPRRHSHGTPRHPVVPGRPETRPDLDRGIPPANIHLPERVGTRYRHRHRRRGLGSCETQKLGPFPTLLAHPHLRVGGVSEQHPSFPRGFAFLDTPQENPASKSSQPYIWQMFASKLVGISEECHISSAFPPWPRTIPYTHAATSTCSNRPVRTIGAVRAAEDPRTHPGQEVPSTRHPSQLVDQTGLHPLPDTRSPPGHQASSRPRSRPVLAGGRRERVPRSAEPVPTTHLFSTTSRDRYSQSCLIGTANPAQ